MKQISALFAAALLTLPLVGCGESTEPTVIEVPVQTQAELDAYEKEMDASSGESTAPQ